MSAKAALAAASRLSETKTWLTDSHRLVRPLALA
jgi:hypothetical protein